jgi:hypothetical protein
MSDFEQADISKYFGVYRGFIPSDDSRAGVAELEITISAVGIDSRVANSSGAHVSSVEAASVRPATREEISASFRAGADDLIRATEGLKVADRFTILFFANVPAHQFSATIIGNQMVDVLGPTLLYSPKQVEDGFFQRALDGMKERYGDKFPVLEHASQ